MFLSHASMNHSNLLFSYFVYTPNKLAKFVASLTKGTEETILIIFKRIGIRLSYTDVRISYSEFCLCEIKIRSTQ